MAINNFLRRFQTPNPEQPLGGRYKVIRQLGEGGFGQTFLAHDLHLPGQPQCVVKLLKPQVSDEASLQVARRLFDTEARVLYQLGSHDQIPRLLAHFEESEEFYLAQEFVEGEQLTEELENSQPWPEVKVIALLQDMLQTLAFVHQQNVIHRDIKPANLIRRRRDGKIVLIDFGAVKQVSTQVLNPKAGMTNMTISIGTQGYMPKEQLGGNPRFSSDVYAVGTIGIQALTGNHPRHLAEDPKTGEIIWRDRVPHINPQLADILEKMVRYDFRERYPTAKEALEALRSLPEELLAMVPPPQPIPKAPTEHIVEELPPTLADETVPANNSFPAAVAPTQPDAHHSSPTLPVSNYQFSSPANSASTTPKPPSEVSASSTVRREHFNQTSLFKPTYIVAAVAALGVVFVGIRAFQPQESTTPDNSQAVSTKPEMDPEQLMDQAKSLLEAEQYDEALDTFNKVIDLNPDLAEAHWGRCYTLNQILEYSQAIEACDRALALNPDDTEALWSKGHALEKQERYQEALQLYQQVTTLKPDYADAWNNKGTTLLALNRPDEAFESFDKATQLKPDYASAWANRGAALWSLKRYDEAIASMDKALEIDPDHPNANDLRQQARRQIGR